MIHIDLKLFVTLSKYHPNGSGGVEVAEGTSVEKLIRDFGIPAKTVKLIFINGKKAQVTRILAEGDRLGLFPPVGGG